MPTYYDSNKDGVVNSTDNLSSWQRLSFLLEYRRKDELVLYPPDGWNTTVSYTGMVGKERGTSGIYVFGDRTSVYAEIDPDGSNNVGTLRKFEIHFLNKVSKHVPFSISKSFDWTDC